MAYAESDDIINFDVTWPDTQNGRHKQEVAADWQFLSCDWVKTWDLGVMTYAESDDIINYNVTWPEIQYGRHRQLIAAD